MARRQIATRAPKKLRTATPQTPGLVTRKRELAAAKDRLSTASGSTRASAKSAVKLAKRAVKRQTRAARDRIK